jgi:hypothetical protein
LGFSVSNDDGVSRILATSLEDGSAVPMNCLVVAGVGGGKSLGGEQLANFYHRNGFTVISLSDVKDAFEFGFSMFEPTAPYHLRKLRKFGCPIGAVPTKLYHPFTFQLPRQAKLPDINFYTLNIKTLTRTDLNFLAESEENKRSIQIILEQLQKLKRDDGLHHLIFNAENQTESVANLTKTGMKFRSDDPDTFFTRSKTGTEKTSAEMSSYFKPFIDTYALAPESAPTNLNIVDIMNDQEHYHVFSTRWITDRRLKAFFILHLLQDIINNETYAKYPICIYLEEIRFLTPAGSEGFTKFLAQEIGTTMTRMRNMGRGFAIISTTQVYRAVHSDVLDTFNETVIGRIGSIKELEFMSKALKLSTQDTNLLKSLEVGDFVIRTKDEFSDESTLQKIRFYLPSHAHKEQGYSFFEWYAKRHPEQMRTYGDLISQMAALKTRIIEEVKVLTEKENATKRDAVKKERDERISKEKEKIKAQMQKVTKTTEKKDAVDEKMQELIWNEWNKADGKDKSLRSIARKFNLFVGSTGDPNAMAVKRAIERYERRRGVNEKPDAPTEIIVMNEEALDENNDEPESAPESSTDDAETIVNDTREAEQLLDDDNDNTSE